uniref:Uncharacterized protein n=1 Tax=Ananas comosus var. bracteatus TaxID=296719 RepID=A0A6V7Q8K6_ANACO|nr:unnamed protein product [Ananas comosus var. bracteatus]
MAAARHRRGCGLRGGATRHQRELLGFEPSKSTTARGRRRIGRDHEQSHGRRLGMGIDELAAGGAASGGSAGGGAASRGPATGGAASGESAAGGVASSDGDFDGASAWLRADLLRVARLREDRPRVARLRVTARSGRPKSDTASNAGVGEERRPRVVEVGEETNGLGNA